MKLLFIGFGNVAKEIARIYIEAYKYPMLGETPAIVGVFTGHHGGVIANHGLDLATVLNNLSEYKALSKNELDISNLSPLEAVDTLEYDVLVELSPLDIENEGEPAASYIRAALKRGKSVVSANKGPVAFHYRELKSLADQNSAKYLFESTVMDGAPVFNLARNCMKGCKIKAFSGILNGTTNFILSFMENGGSFVAGVKKAQDKGITEVDPSMDVEGWDPAAKIAILVNVLMDGNITPKEVEREGISQITPQRIFDALSRGKRIKLICRGWREGDKIRASVKPEEVDNHDIFSFISQFSTAIRIESNLMNPNTIIQNNPCLLDTAYGVIEDIITIGEYLNIKRVYPKKF